MIQNQQYPVMLCYVVRAIGVMLQVAVWFCAVLECVWLKSIVLFLALFSVELGECFSVPSSNNIVITDLRPVSRVVKGQKF